MNKAFKMKSSIAKLMKNSPAKQEKIVGKKTKGSLKKSVVGKKTTARE